MSLEFENLKIQKFENDVDSITGNFHFQIISTSNFQISCPGWKRHPFAPLFGGKDIAHSRIGL
jgi:hypothetical protein